MQQFHDDTVVINPSDQHKYSVIWLHGLGADGHDFTPIVQQLSFASLTNTRFIFPHAPVRPVTLNGGIPMRAWFDIDTLDESAELDYPGIFESRDRIHDMINAEVESGINRKNIIIGGFSQGGSLTIISGLTFPQPLGGLIALSCFIPKNGVKKLQLNSANHDTQIFMGHGKYDPLVPFTIGKHSATELQQHGYQVTWHEYPMEHSVCSQEIDDISGFLASVTSP